MITLENISLSMDTEHGKAQILRDINLDLEDHKFYVFTGPNGGGKSSLAKVIMGIYKPDTGRVLFDGEDITDLDITQRAKLGIGFAFQHPPRFKGLTIGKLLTLAGWNPKEDPMCSVLKVVGLCPDNYLKREIDDSLSGGELKRIEIASILAKKPKFSIFDEPEAGIDLWSFSRLTETFKDYHNNEMSNGMLIISHQERIMELADEIVLISAGRIDRRGTKDEILKKILHTDAYCDFTCDKEINYGQDS